MTSEIVWCNGPDNLCPTDLQFATKLDDAIKVRFASDNSDKKYKPISIYSVFANTVKKNPNHYALCKY